MTLTYFFKPCCIQPLVCLRFWDPRSNRSYLNWPRLKLFPIKNYDHLIPISLLIKGGGLWILAIKLPTNKVNVNLKSHLLFFSNIFNNKNKKKGIFIQIVWLCHIRIGFSRPGQSQLARGCSTNRFINWFCSSAMAPLQLRR